MADYNIYVHAIGTGSASNLNPTIPWSQRENAQGFSQVYPWSKEQEGADIDNISSPSQLVQAGITYARSLFPKVAAAGVVMAIASRLLQVGKSYYSLSVETSGDYRLTTEIQNMKALLNAYLNPIQTQIAWHQNETRLQIENGRKEMERALLGDSVINTYTNRGV